MPVKWISSNFKGVRYYEHAVRKRGVQKDRYFAIRYQKDGKRQEEGLGWASETDPRDGKHWTAEKAALILAELRGSAKTGHGATRLAEKRALENERKEAIKTAKERQKQYAVTFGQYFEDTYYPIAKTSKDKETYCHDDQHFRIWIDPVVGNKPLKDITSFDLERVKKKALDAGRSPRTCQYIMATFRQVWNMARRSGIVSGDSPTRSVKIPKYDNRRQRFLTHKEANLLLDRLNARDETLYQMALLSLRTAMRASEVFNLTWSCIDIGNGTILIMDTKSGKTRAVYMTSDTKTMLKGMNRSKPDDLLFKNRKDKPYKDVPTLFRDVVNDLGFNNNVSDPRQRVCYHTLRHTFASHHAIAGTDLYVLKELLGHSVFAMTERYSHLSKDALQNATENLETGIKQALAALEKEVDKIKIS
jgi:integrase